jgi:hypothetical protein
MNIVFWNSSVQDPGPGFHTGFFCWDDTLGPFSEVLDRTGTFLRGPRLDSEPNSVPALSHLMSVSYSFFLGQQRKSDETYTLEVMPLCVSLWIPIPFISFGKGWCVSPNSLILALRRGELDTHSCTMQARQVKKPLPFSVWGCPLIWGALLLIIGTPYCQALAFLNFTHFLFITQFQMSGVIMHAIVKLQTVKHWGPAYTSTWLVRATNEPLVNSFLRDVPVNGINVLQQ